MERLISLHQKPYSWSVVELGTTQNFFPGSNLPSFICLITRVPATSGKKKKMMNAQKEPLRKDQHLFPGLVNERFVFQAKATAPFFVLPNTYEEMTPLRRQKRRGERFRNQKSNQRNISFSFFSPPSAQQPAQILHARGHLRQKKKSFDIHLIVPVFGAGRRRPPKSRSPFSTWQHL